MDAAGGTDQVCVRGSKMGRVESVSFAGVAITAVQDLFELVVPAGYRLHLHEIIYGQLSDVGDAAMELLAVTIKRGIGNTSGSGGSTATPAKVRTNQDASGITAEINNTTQAVAGSGSLTTLPADVANIHHGYKYKPAPEERFVFAAGEAVIVSLSAPADSLTSYGTLVFSLELI
jgi:hypothetical protein